MMMEKYLIERLENMIQQFSKGREVVLYGCTGPFIKDFEKNIGSIRHIFTTNEVLLSKNPDLFFRPENLEGKRGKYYVVLPITYSTGTFQTELLENYGYCYKKDYCLVKEHLLYDNMQVDSFQDSFQNSISIKSSNVSLNIFGSHNHIDISGNIECSHHLHICIEGSNANLEINQGRLLGDIAIYMKSGSSLFIENGFVLNFSEIRLLEHASIFINEGFTCEEGRLVIHTDDYANLSIGKDNMFSSDVVIQASDGHIILDIETGKIINWDPVKRSAGSISLGDHVWIGKRAMLLGGIKRTNIGEGSVVGAGSVVKGCFPNNVCIAGNPAKIIRRNIAWSRHAIPAKNFDDCRGFCKRTMEIIDEL